MTQNQRDGTQKPDRPGLNKALTALIDDDENTQMHHSAALGKEGDFDKTMAGRVNVENYLGWTPLMMACRNGHLGTVKVLLELSADATRKNKFGTSTFLISVSSGKLEIVTLILHHLLTGGISKRCIQSILSPLSLAILFRHQHVLEYLISQKFDINAATPITGITPLMFASAMEDAPAHALLARHRADASLQNALGRTADGIRQARQQQKRAPPRPPKPSAPLTPAELISMSPHMTALARPPPYYYVAGPPNALYVLSPEPAATLLRLRKSSNALTPSPDLVLAATPNVTPIGCHPQVFFPPEFAAGGRGFCGAVPCSPLPPGEFLNARLGTSSSNVYLSPNVLQDGRTPSYCV